MKKNLRVLVVSGASAGHIFPALGFYSALKEKDPQAILLLLLQKSKINKNLNLPQAVKYIPILPLKAEISFKTLWAIFNFLVGSLKALLTVAAFNPEVIVGFGSLVSVPVILSGWLLRKKTLIHEQNVLPGAANRFLAYFCDQIAISFPETKNYFPDQREKIIHTGNPLRPELKKIAKDSALAFFDFIPQRFTILVSGGSSGCQSINLGFLKAISAFPQKYKLQVIHLCGAGDYQFLAREYRHLDISLQLFSFLPQMQYAYSAADLILCRAGATTVSEIIFYQIPALLIPYPYAKQHQLANARILKEQGTAQILDDSDLKEETLGKVLKDLLENKDKIQGMRMNFARFSQPPAGAILAERIYSLSYS